MGGDSCGELLSVADSFARHRGWITSRRANGGLPSSTLIGLLDSLGIATVFDHLAVLNESFFHQIRHEAEEMEVGAALEPMAMAMGDYLGSLTLNPGRS